MKKVIVLVAVLALILASGIGVLLLLPSLWPRRAPTPPTADVRAVVENLKRKQGSQVPATVTRLTNDLKRSGFEKGLEAADELSEQGAAAVPSLAEVLVEATSPDVRFCALFALGRIGPEARDCAPIVVWALKEDPEASVRSKAAFALGRLRPEAASTHPVLVEALRDKDEDVRQEAARALAAWGSEAVPALRQVLKEGPANARVSAIQGLAHMGAEAGAAVDDLQVVLFGSDESLRQEAVTALTKIGKPAIPVLVKAVDHDKSAFRLQAVQTLSQMGPEGADALVDALKAQHADARGAAAMWLGSLNVTDRRAVLGLAGAAAKDKDPAVRSQACSALGNLAYQLSGRDADAARAALKEATKDPDPAVKQTAQQMLNNLNRFP